MKVELNNIKSDIQLLHYFGNALEMLSHPIYFQYQMSPIPPSFVKETLSNNFIYPVTFYNSERGTIQSCRIIIWKFAPVACKSK